MSKPEFDWHESPLPEAQRRLAELKIIYDKAAVIVQTRQQKLPVSYHCWTHVHQKDLMDRFAEVVRQCKNEIPDGKWVFRNDGDVDSSGRPSVCCSQKCYLVYWQMLSENKHQQRLGTAAVEATQEA